MDLRAIIFDLDGVLISGSNEGYLDCHAFALSSVGLEIPRDEQRRRLLEFWSYPHEFQLGLFITDPGQLETASRVYEEYLFSERFFSRVQPIPGAGSIVRQLASSGLRLAIATGMHVRQVPIALRLLGMARETFLDVISGYEIDDNSLQKPHPFMLTTLLGRLGVGHDQAIYIGDSRDDIRMAKAAKVTSVAVLTGNLTQDDARAEGADYILRSVIDLPRLPFVASVLQRTTEA